LTELTLDPPDATSDQAGVPRLDEDYLILSTIHSAKDQEWKSVFVLNAVDGCITSDLGTDKTAEIEESAAFSTPRWRAKDYLHLIVPQRTSRMDRTRRGPAYLRLKDALHFGRSVEPVQQDGLAGDRGWTGEGGGPSQGVRGDAGARMRGMWR
jgi:DNA helicase-2/ATP-dependent DNA helicase PcrA